MSETVDNLLYDLATWLAQGPRPYGEVMEVWRTSCPRLSIWEEAVERRMVARRAGADGAQVFLTEEGHAWIVGRRTDT
jgi:hypothetical protein